MLSSEWGELLKTPKNYLCCSIIQLHDFILYRYNSLKYLKTLKSFQNVDLLSAPISRHPVADVEHPLAVQHPFHSTFPLPAATPAAPPSQAETLPNVLMYQKSK